MKTNQLKRKPQCAAFISFYFIGPTAEL